MTFCTQKCIFSRFTKLGLGGATIKTHVPIRVQLPEGPLTAQGDPLTPVRLASFLIRVLCTSQYIYFCDNTSANTLPRKLARARIMGRRRVWGGRWRRLWQVAHWATLLQKWPPHPRNGLECGQFV